MLHETQKGPAIADLSDRDFSSYAWETLLGRLKQNGGREDLAFFGQYGIDTLVLTTDNGSVHLNAHILQTGALPELSSVVNQQNLWSGMVFVDLGRNKDGYIGSTVRIDGDPIHEHFEDNRPLTQEFFSLIHTWDLHHDQWSTQVKTGDLVPWTGMIAPPSLVKDLRQSLKRFNAAERQVMEQILYSRIDLADRMGLIEIMDQIAHISAGKITLGWRVREEDENYGRWDYVMESAGEYTKEYPDKSRDALERTLLKVIDKQRKKIDRVIPKYIALQCVLTIPEHEIHVYLGQDGRIEILSYDKDDNLEYEEQYKARYMKSWSERVGLFSWRHREVPISPKEYTPEQSEKLRSGFIVAFVAALPTSLRENLEASLS